jgi:hypothetical protein
MVQVYTVIVELAVREIDHHECMLSRWIQVDGEHRGLDGGVVVGHRWIRCVGRLQHPHLVILAVNAIAIQRSSSPLVSNVAYRGRGTGQSRTQSGIERICLHIQVLGALRVLLTPPGREGDGRVGGRNYSRGGISYWEPKE